LLNLFGPHKIIPDDKIVSNLIYTTTRNLKMQALTVVDKARKTPGGQLYANSNFERSFHSCNGPMAKDNVVKDFTGGCFLVIASTT
jgi:hypothetical protein